MPVHADAPHGKTRRSACSVVLRGSTTWRAVADADVSSRFERFGASGRVSGPCTREGEHSGQRRRVPKRVQPRRPRPILARVASAHSPRRPSWLDELDLKAGPPWLSMGIRTLDLDRWLVVDDRYADRARSQAPPAVRAPRRRVRGPPGGPRRQHRGARAGHRLARRPPPRPPPTEPVARGPQGPIGLPVRGRRGSWRHPLDAAGRLVQEDLCVLVEQRRQLQARGGVAVLPLALAAAREARAVAGRHPRARSPTTPRSSRPRSTPSSAGSASTAPWCAATCRSTATTTSTGPSPTSRRTRSPRMRPASTRSGSAASARRWSGSPRTGAVLFTIKTQLCPVTALRQRPDLAGALADEAGRRAGRPRAPGATPSPSRPGSSPGSNRLEDP